MKNWQPDRDDTPPITHVVDSLHLIAFDSLQVIDVLLTILPTKLLILELGYNHSPTILEELLAQKEIFVGVGSLVVYVYNEGEFN